MTHTKRLIDTIKNYPHDGSAFMDRIKRMANAAANEGGPAFTPGTNSFDRYVFLKVNSAKDVRNIASRHSITEEEVLSAYNRGSELVMT